MRGEVARGRRRAEAQMLDTCVVTRPGEGDKVWNPDTGTYDPVPPVTVYPPADQTGRKGRCKVQTRDVQVATADVAGREAFIVEWRLDLPVVGSEGVRQGDTATITAAELDAALVGRSFVVQSTHVGTAKTARRLPVVAEVTAP
jgi:hypothetical protein